MITEYERDLVCKLVVVGLLLTLRDAIGAENAVPVVDQCIPTKQGHALVVTWALGYPEPRTSSLKAINPTRNASNDTREHLIDLSRCEAAQIGFVPLRNLPEQCHRG